MSVTRVGIVGAGLTGLITAKILSEKGIDVVIYEKLDRPGGRMTTELVSGWNLDIGFQVILSAYPLLKKHVNLDDLDAVRLDAAASVLIESQFNELGDPFRTKGVLLKTIFSNLGSLKDKYLVFKLYRYVSKTSVEEIFLLDSLETVGFLKNFGFSNTFIMNFFKPFFGGIFLEAGLKTSQRMFLFVFKMFATGQALLPKKGIGELAKTILKNLNDVEIHYASNVIGFDELNSSLTLETGSVVEFDFIVNTIPKQDTLIENWQGCYNLYFEHDSPALITALRIGLNANSDRFINNFFYPSSIRTPADKVGKCLLSITVLNNKGLEETDLIDKIIEELHNDFGLKNSNLKLIKSYVIPQSLPIIEEPSYSIPIAKLNGRVINMGDYLMNGSQNAACQAGEIAASYILENIVKK